MTNIELNKKGKKMSEEQKNVMRELTQLSEEMGLYDKEIKLENPLEQTVLPEGPLKHLLIDYVGNKLQPVGDQVTLEMLLTVIAEEFPEVLLVVAEENFIRGYKQAMQDVESMSAVQEKVNESQEALEAEIIDE